MTKPITDAEQADTPLIYLDVEIKPWMTPNYIVTIDGRSIHISEIPQRRLAGTICSILPRCASEG